MTFDRFFRVALLVVLGAFVVVYFVDTQKSVYGQQGTTKDASDILRPYVAGLKRATVQKPREVGRYQFAVDGGTLYALDTRTGQLYILRDRPMNLKETAQRTKWQKWYGFTEQPRKFGPKGEMGTLKPQ